MQTASGHLTVSSESKEPYAAQQLAQLHADAEQVIARYPQKRSALLPLLHLVQSIDGYVTGRGIDFCAELLELTRAEVSGVATFYTQYKRHPNGEYTVGVCTNTLCAIMGGDEIWDSVSEHLGIGHDETTADGKVTLERIECNAACDYAPVVMANWEFFDNQTPESTNQLVDDLRAGTSVKPTRGASSVCSFKQMSRVLAGFSDGLADEGVGAGPASVAGLALAHENGWEAPKGADPSAEELTESAEDSKAEKSADKKDAPAPKADDSKSDAQTDTKASPEGEKLDGKASGRHSSVNAHTNKPDEKPGGQPAKSSAKKPEQPSTPQAQGAPASLFDDGSVTAEAEPRGGAPLTGTPASPASQGAPDQTGGEAPEGFSTSSFDDGIDDVAPDATADRTKDTKDES